MLFKTFIAFGSRRGNMAAQRLKGILQRLFIFYLFYILLRGLQPVETSERTGGISCLFSVAKSLARVELSTTTRRVTTKLPKVPFQFKLSKACQLMKYCSLAALILLAGDISPNPGWNQPVLNKPGLKISHLNIRSLPAHFDEFRILMHDNPFDIMCLTETWLNSSDSNDEIHIDGYNIIRTDRDDVHRGGGTAIYYNAKLNARQRTDINAELDIEATWLEVTSPNRSKTLICSTYCPDKESYCIFRSDLERMLERASVEGSEQLYLGDFNQDLLPKKLSADARDLRQLLASYQFTQLIKDPTRITARSETLLDHIYTTDTGKVTASGVTQCSISDHSLTYVIRRARKQRGPSKNINYRNFKNYSTENFQDDLHQTSWESVNTSLTVEDGWNEFITTFTRVSDRHAPLATKRARAVTLPWLTNEIRAAMRKRDFYHRRAQKTKTDNDWIVYKDLRNKTTHLIRDSKRNYYSNVINANKKDQGKLWKTLKSAISNTKKSPHVGLLETTAGIKQEPHEIAHGFSDHFRTAVTKIRSNLQAVCTRSTPRKSSAVLRLSSIKEDFVCSELRKIKATKSTGLDNIPARLLKDGAVVISKPLTILLNRSLTEGTIPSDWKHATITPIHKSGSTSDAANYRPISTLPVFAKILERAVHAMVYSYLQEHRLLSKYQSGYRPLHSTCTCLADVTNKLLHNMDKGQLTGMVFLDLSKAFDTIDHYLMLDKLISLGFSDTAVIWFKAYLTDRTQSVRVNGVVSDPQPIQFGVPQGSILGPLLFITYINDLPSVVKNCDIQLYADDTLLFYSSNSIEDIESCLSADLSSIISWLDSNYLFLNYKKTKVMLTGTHQRLAKVNDFCVLVNSKTLGRVYQFKYLGLVLDPTLSWNDHIDHMSSKISSRLGMLRKARKVIPRDACITLYNAMILPLFDYCAAVWDGCSKTNRDYLDKLQARAASIIEGRKVVQSEIQELLGWPTLDTRRKYQICLQVFKCINGLAPAYLIDNFQFSRDFHHYNTRNKDQIRLPRAKTSKYQSSFKYHGAKTWNDLPAHIRNETGQAIFKNRLKKYLFL